MDIIIGGDSQKYRPLVECCLCVVKRKCPLRWTLQVVSAIRGLPRLQFRFTLDRHTLS